MPGYTVLDIETTPIPFVEREVIDYLMDKKTRRDFHPFFARAVATGLKDEGAPPIILAQESEKDMLTEFWSQLDINQPNLVVTFNGMGFDVPFLFFRSVANNVAPTFPIEINKYKMETSNHFDCMHALSVKGAFTWVSLDIACRLLGIPMPRGRVKGSRIEESYKEGDWELIRNRALQDLELTEQLFLKIRPFFSP